MRLKIRRPEELKVFDSLRLSVVVLVEIFLEVLAEVLVELAVELLAELVAELITELIAELEARAKIRQLKKLKVFNSLRLSVVLLIAIRY